MDVDWPAFAKVFLAAFTGAVSLVLFYSLGTRMLVHAGRTRKPASAECATATLEVTGPDSTPSPGRAAAPADVTGRQRVALALALVCFALCAAAVAGGLLLILVG